MLKVKTIIIVSFFLSLGFAQDSSFELAKDFPVLTDLGGVGRGEVIQGFGGIKSSYPLKHNPVLFVHGNGGNHTNFYELAALFKKAGYSKQELWAFSYMGMPSKMNAKGDPHTREVADLNQVIQALIKYTGAKKIDIIAHSLGVSLSLFWMKKTNSYHKVERFVMIAGVPNGFPNVALSSEWRKVWMEENIRLENDASPYGSAKDLNFHKAPEKNKKLTYLIVYAGKDDKVINMFGENSHSSLLDGADALYNLEGKLKIPENATEMEKACGIHCTILFHPQETFFLIKKHFGLK